MQSRIKAQTHFKEASTPSKNGSQFQVVLIQEGLGNLKDCFYYTKESLQNSLGLFEGKKCYADHPSSLEENIRPERSTRDIIGYYKNVQYSETGDGRGQLLADLITVADPNLSWANSLLQNSIQYAQAFPNSDFVGLSINASGEANDMRLSDFMSGNDIPQSVLSKLQEAQTQGIDTIRVVSALKDATSCDMVTDAGAGGKILKMIESSKREKIKMAEKKSHEKKEAHKKEADESSKKEAGTNPKDNLSEAGEDGQGVHHSGGPGAMGSGDSGMGQPNHADADQDKALFAQLISQYLGDDADGVNEEEAIHMAKHAHQAAMEAGMSHEQAKEAARKHMKMAHEIGKRKHQSQKETHHQEEDAMAKNLNGLFGFGG